jgi:glycine dehydrogenase subunit 1
MRYFNHAPESVRHMLETLGKSSLDDLFSSIPLKLRYHHALDLPPPKDELNLKRELSPFCAKPHLINFIGAGATEHFVPEWVSQQLLRAEWYTSYTPYQPEVSQGTLQAIFEFQSIVASLFGMEIANASMYDGATALVEAVLMATRVTAKKSVAISLALHPEYRATLKSYLSPIGITIIELDFDENGMTKLSSLEAALQNQNIAAVALQSPNFFGAVEEMPAFASLIHQHQGLLITCTTDPSACVFLGECGADIAVGEGLGFVGALSLGGPGVGLLAAKKSLLRQMPGRLVGQTTDKFGKLGFTLTLSTREQHIRREKATSNICTNHNLMALAFAMSMAAYGKSGLKNLAFKNVQKTLLFRRYLQESKLSIAFNSHHYNETVVSFEDDATLDQRLSTARGQSMVAGLKLSLFYPKLNGHLLINTTELHTDEDIKKLAQILSGANHE